MPNCTVVSPTDASWTRVEMYVQGKPKYLIACPAHGLLDVLKAVTATLTTAWDRPDDLAPTKKRPGGRS